MNMRSAISYSRLSVEETVENPETSSSRRFVQNIPAWMKRIIFLFALIAGTSITFFYVSSNETPLKNMTKEANITWNDLSISEIIYEDAFSEALFQNESLDPIWTWTCDEMTTNKRCVRTSATNTLIVQSLKTCNMRCLKVPIWPEPTGYYYFDDDVVTVDLKSLALDISNSSSLKVSQYLQEAFAFMKGDIHSPMKYVKETMNKEVDKKALKMDIRVTVEDDVDPNLRLDTKESYNLQIKCDENNCDIYINATSFCGARHGFETLSQLIWYDSYTESVLSLKSVIILKDAPKFKYRGLLLDTARQFFPVADILRTIDAMAASKFNTFHWHATDSQSFPLKLNSVPQLALYGAYSLRKVYTVDDIRTIVHRARVRGIRVVIEIDAPAHVGRSWSWGNSTKLGELAYCVEYDPWKGYCGEPPCGQLNPSNIHVYDILEKIYKEIIELTGVHDVFHLGGDEVKPACWNKFMNDSFFMDTWYTFSQKSLNALQNANNGKLPLMRIIWSSKLTSGSLLNYMKNYTIQLWGPSKWQDIQSITETKARTIVSNVDAWYLDCGFDQWFENGGACQPYRKWQVMYNHRPWQGHNWNMAGGTTCMWTEQLAPEDIDARIWPRAAAVAERLWTDPPNEATADEYLRMDMQRERLVARGVRADVNWSRWCSDNPYQCYPDNV